MADEIIVNPSVKALIQEMLDVRTTYPTIERNEILTIFNIAAMKELANEIQKLRLSK